MNSRKLFALFLVLALTGSALAVQQERLYRTVTSSDSVNPTAEGVIGIQQHSVFVEIVVEVRQNVTQIHQFAAVVGLVKKCKQVRNVFDNAVLWFNDQFLFGNKSNQTVNVTPPEAIGENPQRVINLTDLLDDNRNNGTGQYNASTGGYEADQIGIGPNEGGNPDRDGFVANRNRTLPNGNNVTWNFERWGGCFIPNGFIHAIASDDPYSTGSFAKAKGEVGPPANASVDEDIGIDDVSLIFDNIDVTKLMIDLDNSCGGCLFEYVGTFYITDPNNHRWMIDKFVYPLDMAGFFGLGEDPTDCHIGPGSTDPIFGLAYVPVCGLEDAERHRDRAEDDGIPENQFYDDGECEANRPATGPDESECTDEDGDGDYDSDPSDTEWDQENEQNNENFDNHCNESDNSSECVSGEDDPTDVKGVECEGGDLTNTTTLIDTAFCAATETKFTTKEPMYTVHIQVDPWNPDRQGFPDEAIWAYRDGTLRVGMPYGEGEYDANGDFVAPPDQPGTKFCHDAAVVTDINYEYDYLEAEGGPAEKKDLDEAPFGSTVDWAHYRRGPVGNTVECAIEYNFLIAVDFEAFDDLPTIAASADAGVANASVVTQDAGEGENEILRNFKQHGEGGVDDGDKAWQGNSHPHNPMDVICPDYHRVDGTPTDTYPDPVDPDNHDFDEGGLNSEHPTVACEDNPNATTGNPQHEHDAIALDLFFYASAPFFVEQNPYWDHANETDSIKTTGTPPIVDDECKTAPNLPPDDYRRQAVEARIPIVCDVDAMDGYHLHDGTQTIPIP